MICENHVGVVLAGGVWVTLGRAERQGDLFDEVTRFCGGAVAQDSVYALLHRERDRLFPDVLFADLFTGVGRRSVPPSIVAVVMVLQKLGGLSDREAVERFTFDARWRYAAGVGGWDREPVGFAHTVLVDMRARLRGSADPERIRRVTVDVAGEAGLLGVRRALDSTPLFDAVATQDTVTLVRSAVRGLLRVCGGPLAAEVRGVLARDDDYVAAGKPPCDWDDTAAREQLVDALAIDAHAALAVLEGRELAEGVVEAAALLATVVGQDVEPGDDGRFRIARRVAKDRVISTVDPDARHGHKTSARGFDGYKGHVAVDPDAEIVTATTVTPANTGDADATAQLLGEFTPPAATPDGDAGGCGPVVYGDAAYGSGANLARLHTLHATVMVKVPPPPGQGGRFPKDRFAVDPDAATVVCPAGHTALLRGPADGDREATFGAVCAGCPLRTDCTNAKAGRTVKVGPHERLLAAARAEQADPAWQAGYRATRPKVERRLAHLVRRSHGGRRARTRGLQRVAQDWDLAAAARNIARLAALKLRHTTAGWQTATA